MNLRAVALPLSLAALALAPAASAQMRFNLSRVTYAPGLSSVRLAPTSTRAVAAPTPVPTPACVPLAVSAVNPGVSVLTLAAATGRECAAPNGVPLRSAQQAMQTVTVRSRVALALSSDAGNVELVDANRNAVLSTVDGLCAPGTRTGAAIVEPGTYVLRAVDGAAGDRAVRVEAIAVPARATLEGAGVSRVAMSTATAQSAPFDCLGDEGVSVRVLVCPRGRAVLSSPQGFLASIEGASAPRTCYPVAAQAPVAASMPGDTLVVMRAWPRGDERGLAFADVR